MGNGSDPKLEIESEPLFPGFTEKVPKDVVANLDNVTLEVTTIIVCTPITLSPLPIINKLHISNFHICQGFLIDR